jgi:hypothetical protein
MEAPFEDVTNDVGPTMPARDWPGKIDKCQKAGSGRTWEVGRGNRELRDAEETSAMTTVPITLHVDPEAAKAFESASEEERRKIDIVLGLRLKELLNPTGMTLREAMDRIGREAEANGLTPEILESILRGEDGND